MQSIVFEAITRVGYLSQGLNKNVDEDLPPLCRSDAVTTNNLALVSHVRLITFERFAGLLFHQINKGRHLLV